MRRPSPLLLLGILIASGAKAESPAPPAKDCRSFFSRLSSRLIAHHTNPDPAAFEQLRHQTINDYFPGTQEIELQPTVKGIGADLNDAAVARFHSDFDKLLDQRAVLFNLKADDFRAWLTKTYGSPYPKLDSLTVENVFKKQKMSLEDLQSSYYMAYAVEMKKTGIDVLKSLRLKDIARIGTKATIGGAMFVLGMLKSGLVNGPTSNAMNSLFSAPMQSILDSLGQISNVLFAKESAAIQRFMTKNTKAITQNVAAISTTTTALDDTNFNGLSRDEAKTVLAGFDTRYYNMFMRMNAYMPPYKRSGRDLIRDWALLQPLQIVTSAATFENSYTLNKALYDALNEKLAGKEPTADQKAQLQVFKTNMDDAQDRLAGTLATWRIYSFMYAEVSRDPQVKDVNDVMFNTLGRYEDSMDLNKYRDQLSSRMKGAFHNFDPSFTGLDKLDPANESAPPPAPKSP